jgi:hypothetical protein
VRSSGALLFPSTWAKRWSRFRGMRPRSGSGGSLVRCLLAAVLASLFALTMPTAAVADSPGLVWSASVDGHDVRSASRNAPLELGASDQARVEINLDNRGTSEIRVRSVRIEGRVIGMAFFSYTTRLDIVLPPGEHTQRRFDIDISDLTHQATGLLPTSVILIAPDRKSIDDENFAVDVRGSVVSVYGAFGLIMAGITAVVLAGLLVSIWRRQLPRNRWQRGLRFLPAGLGIGLVLTFTLSATRLLVPSALWWLPLLLLCGGGAFLLGYLLPVGADQPAAPVPTDPDGTVVQQAGPITRASGAHR